MFKTPKCTASDPFLLGPSLRVGSAKLHAQVGGRKYGPLLKAGPTQAHKPRAEQKVITHFHGCCWETFYIFAYCGLVENPHLTAKLQFFAPLPTSKVFDHAAGLQQPEVEPWELHGTKDPGLPAAASGPGEAADQPGLPRPAPRVN